MHYLKDELDIFLSNIAATESLLFQTTTHLYNYKKIQEKAWEGNPINDPLMGSTLIIGDLTGLTDKGWAINYPTGFTFKLYVSDLGKSIDKLISRDGMRSVATCYEIFETFLFDVCGAYINANLHLAPLPLRKNHKPIGERENAKDYLRRSYRSTNNGEILNLIGQLAQSFADARTENNLGFDLQDWYKVLSKVRHATVHQLFKINLPSENFTKVQKALFHSYFTSSQIDQITEIQMTNYEAKKQIKLIAEYGFLIFKCFCIQENLNWKVLMRME